MRKKPSMPKQLLNAVWNEDEAELRCLLERGADPNWIFNGYPILMHAVSTRNKYCVMTLIEFGAVHVQEALGFALDRGIGELVLPLAFLGIVPKPQDVVEEYGPYPLRYCPLDMDYSSIVVHR